MSKWSRLELEVGGFVKTNDFYFVKLSFLGKSFPVIPSYLPWPVEASLEPELELSGLFCLSLSLKLLEGAALFLKENIS